MNNLKDCYRVLSIITRMDGTCWAMFSYFRCHPNDDPARVARIVAFHDGDVGSLCDQSAEVLALEKIIDDGSSKRWQTPTRLERQKFNLMTRGKVASLNPDEIYGPVTSKNVVVFLDGKPIIKRLYVSAWLPDFTNNFNVRFAAQDAIGKPITWLDSNHFCDRGDQFLHQPSNAERNHIIWGDSIPKQMLWNQVTPIELTVEQIESLVEAGFLELDEGIGAGVYEGPSIEHLMEFLWQNPNVRAYGVVSPFYLRIEGVELTGERIPEDAFAFVNFASNSNELIINPDRLYARWD